MNKNIWKTIGPGIIWAGAAIGVSHLVQSTRAGANFGFQLVWIVVLANIIKYPFFEFGPRYAAATGESLVEGYRRLGKWAVPLFFALTLGTMFTIQAAVTSVTVGLLSSLIPSPFGYIEWTLLLLLLCGIIVFAGKYKTLDKTIKLVILVLTFSTIIALVAATLKPNYSVKEIPLDFDWSFENVAFLLALVGWMPSAIDISVWHSMWTLAKAEQTGYKPKVKEALLDFNIGYWGTAILAICFLSLGALVMHGSGETFSPNGTKFSQQLIAMYTQTIGSWSYWIIGIAALATMFSTTLTVLDAYPRVLTPVTQIFIPKWNKKNYKLILNVTWITVLIIGSMLLITFFKSRMKMLVDIATTLSFITAPVLGFMNLKVITAKNMPSEHKPGKAMLVLSYFGLALLGAFAVYYLLRKSIL